jgi:hypothetical protein
MAGRLEIMQHGWMNNRWIVAGERVAVLCLLLQSTASQVFGQGTFPLQK